MKGRRQPAAERFAEKYVISDEGCWEWQARRNAAGYGQFAASPQDRWYAHRWSYTHHVGPIAVGLQLDHLCRNPGCVNPAHLEPVTPRENQRRGDTFTGRADRAASCPHGHPWSEENTYRRKDNGTRQCRACTRLRVARIWARRKATAPT